MPSSATAPPVKARRAKLLKVGNAAWILELNTSDKISSSTMAAQYAFCAKGLYWESNMELSFLLV